MRRFFAVCAIGVFLYTNTSNSYAAPLDFDGDGISDVCESSDQADGSPNELVYDCELSSDSSNFYLEYGNSTDTRAPGDYDKDGTTEAGYIRNSDGALTWYYKSSETGSTESIAFGTEGDTLIAGCDLDLDGFTDPTVIHQGVLQSLHSSDSLMHSTPMTLPEGAAINDILCAKDGEGASSIVFILDETVDDNSGGGDSTQTPKEICLALHPKIPGASKKKKRRRKKRFKKCKREQRATQQQASSEEEESSTETQKTIRRYSTSDGSEIESHIIEGNYKGAVVADFDADGRDETGYFYKESSSVTTIKYYLAGATEASSFETPRFSEVTTGVYENSLGEGVPALLLRHNGTLYRLFLDSQQAEQITPSLDGDELLKTVHFKTSLPGSITTLCDEIREARDGTNGFLYKEADHGGLVVLFPSVLSQVFSTVTLINNLGNIEAKLYYTGKANGNRQHWRHSKSANSFPDNSYIRANRSSGSICYSLGNVSSRID